MVWDDEPFQGFVKVEIRGGPRNVKQKTALIECENGKLNWNQPSKGVRAGQMKLEVLSGAKELRVIVCRLKQDGSKTGTSVVAACGLYVKDVLQCVPIDKYFELFKPHQGGPGGFVRVKLEFSTAEAGAEAAEETTPLADAAPGEGRPGKERRGGLSGLIGGILKLGLLGGVVYGGLVATKEVQKRAGK